MTATSAAAQAPGRAGSGDVVLFCALACAFSWADWGLILASARGWIPVSVPLNPWGSFGPAVAALVVCGYRDGLRGIRTLLRGILAWRFGWRLWLVALLGPSALVALALAVYVVAGGDLQPWKAADVGQLLLLAVIVLVVGGPLGEEIGWRGYLLPQLLRRTGPLAASLLVAAVWAVWHLPLFWVPGATQEGSSIPAFIAFVAGFSILTTWLYVASGGSLLAAILFHNAINVSTFAGPMVQPTLEGRGFYRVFLVVTWAATLGAIWALSRRRSGRGSEAALRSQP
jgi:membrane protease YdiL (CAAX protease family)